MMPILFSPARHVLWLWPSLLLSYLTLELSGPTSQECLYHPVPPLLSLPLLFLYLCASCRGSPNPSKSCWMTSTLWSGCCAVFPLTAQGAGQSPWMPRWRITCTSAPTTCASSGTGCTQARMILSASTVPPATKLAAATTLAGTDCFASCTFGRRAHLFLSLIYSKVMWLAFSCLDGIGARLPGSCSVGCSSPSCSPSSLPS